MCSFTMKYCRNPGVARSAKMYHGTATMLAAIRPVTQGSLRTTRQFLVRTSQAASERPTSTTATGPLARQPKPSDKKKARPHHASLCSPFAPAFAKRAKHIRAPLTLAASAMSSTHEPASTKNKPEEAKISPASAPTRSPHIARPKAIVLATISAANRKFGKRAAHSDGPNAPKDSAVVQKKSGGFAQKGTSSPDIYSRGVTQSPERCICQPIS